MDKTDFVDPLMTSKTKKEIEATKNKLAALEKKAATEQLKQIANLHKEAGFATREELIAALQSLGSGTASRGGKPSKAKKTAKAPTAKKAAKSPKAKKVANGAKKRAKRAVVTPELRQGIIDALKAGGKGNAVAAKFGVSVPTLHNIKKAAGLTKSRK